MHIELPPTEGWRLRRALLRPRPPTSADVLAHAARAPPLGEPPCKAGVETGRGGLPRGPRALRQAAPAHAPRSAVPLRARARLSPGRTPLAAPSERLGPAPGTRVLAALAARACLLQLPSPPVSSSRSQPRASSGFRAPPAARFTPRRGGGADASRGRGSL